MLPILTTFVISCGKAAATEVRRPSTCYLAGMQNHNFLWHLLVCLFVKFLVSQARYWSGIALSY